MPWQLTDWRWEVRRHSQLVERISNLKNQDVREAVILPVSEPSVSKAGRERVDCVLEPATCGSRRGGSKSAWRGGTGRDARKWARPQVPGSR